jgi:Na+/proline symporter
MSLSTTGTAIFAGYLALMFLIGIICYRYQKNMDSFWVANRRVSLPIMVMVMLASVMHGGTILSGVALAAKFGGVAILPFASMAIGTLIILIYFAEKLRLMAGYTLPDYMGERFDSRFLRGYSAVVVAVSCVVYLIAQIRVMGFVLQQLLGVSFVTGLFLGTAIFVFYVTFGGFLAVVWTDVAQFWFMWLGLFVLIPGIHHLVGGWTDVLAKVETVAPGWTSPKGVSWSWTYLISWNIVWLVAYATRVELITKIFAAKDVNVARFALPLNFAMVVIFLLYGNLYLGAAARTLVWDKITNPDQAFPMLVSTAVSPFLASLALTGIIAAAMSTTSSLLIIAGASIAHDLLRKCYYEPSGVFKSDKFYLLTSRLVIFIVGVIAFIGAIRTPELILVLVSYAVAFLGVTFFFPLLFGLRSKRLGKAAATASAVGGSVITALWMVLDLAKVPWAKEIHPVVPGLVVAFLLITVLSRFTQPVSERCLAKFFAEGIPLADK